MPNILNLALVIKSKFEGALRDIKAFRKELQQTSRNTRHPYAQARGMRPKLDARLELGVCLL